MPVGFTASRVAFEISFTATVVIWLLFQLRGHRVLNASVKKSWVTGGLLVSILNVGLWIPSHTWALCGFLIGVSVLVGFNCLGSLRTIIKS